MYSAHATITPNKGVAVGAFMNDILCRMDTEIMKKCYWDAPTRSYGSHVIRKLIVPERNQTATQPTPK